eukprot:1645741-Alexandrium_andersonii.AAC.1
MELICFHPQLDARLHRGLRVQLDGARRWQSDKRSVARTAPQLTQPRTVNARSDRGTRSQEHGNHQILLPRCRAGAHAWALVCLFVRVNCLFRVRSNTEHTIHHQTGVVTWPIAELMLHLGNGS